MVSLHIFVVSYIFAMCAYNGSIFVLMFKNYPCEQYSLVNV